MESLTAHSNTNSMAHRPNAHIKPTTIKEHQMSTDVTEVFGCNVFNEVTMRERLPKNVFNSLKKTLRGEQPLDRPTADVIANAMKDWAISKGATHFCHWFQPMTGLTAEKHDAFISPTTDGRTMMEFSGKELTQGLCLPLALHSNSLVSDQ